jgi:lipoic acid synthetase
MKMPGGEHYMEVKSVVASHKLNTICTSGNCPNIGECWAVGTATFMILGNICTRACKFCAVPTGKPEAVDIDEPFRIANSILKMGLNHAVITSVDRDDLEDRGATAWAETIKVLHNKVPGLTIETLIPDFDGKPELIDMVINAGPDVISHNMETVRRLTPLIRTKARYETSLSVISRIAKSGITAKSGLMLGLGEREDEILELMDDLLAAGCRILTIGQYLQPTLSHLPVELYVEPKKFEEYKKIALKKGFRQVESSPLVRSSYQAARHVPPKIVFEDLGLIDYKEAWDYQEKLFDEWQKFKVNAEKGKVPGHKILFCEHPHVYTLGKSGDENNMLIQTEFLKQINATYYRINRGGDITYHGPGQIVGYPIINLEEFGLGLKSYISLLEEAIITLLSLYGIKGERKEGAIGVWIDATDTLKARKICAIGVRSSRSVTMHGFALNVNTDLKYFTYINPCGFKINSVTSIQKEINQDISLTDVTSKLRDILLVMLR